MLISVNPTDSTWTRQRFILWFGAYGSTHLLIWANHLEDALDEAIDYLAENKPGLLATKAVEEEYQRLVSEGEPEESAMEKATVDTTCAGNHGDYVCSWEWGITAENPDRATILRLQDRAT